MYTQIKTEKEIEYMRVSGKMLASVLKILIDSVQPGIKGKELAQIAKKELISLGGKPAFLGYQGFPDVLCVSVNQQVVHGIPNKKKIEDGDLVSLDFGVNYRGMITDSALTVIAGDNKASKHYLLKQKLLDGTKESLYAGIDVIKSGVRVGDIGSAIEKVLKKYGFGIVREFVGHGVGHHVHEGPNIPNYGVKDSGDILRAGMTVAIEPMSTLGGEAVVIGQDGWTVSTKDKSLSAHFEHTVLITESSAEVLTESL